MVRPASIDKNGMKRGAWSEEEDHKLRACISRYGHSNWRLLPLVAGLRRCGKSCRLRWVNYLKPGLRRGNFTKDEKHLIIELHNQLGNKWSAIAAHFPGRTDNDIKNYWHAHIQKRRNRHGLTRAIRIQNLAQEEESSDNNSSSITTFGPNQDTTAGIFGVFDSNADSSFNPNAAAADDDDDQYDQLLFTNFNQHNFIEHENMIMSPIICDYLDLGVSHWNYLTDVKPEPDHFSTHTLPVGEDFFNFNVFGDNYYEYSQLYENMGI